LAIAQAIWSYRGFIFGSVQREFQARYRNTLLGAVWTIINPLAMIFIYTVIFSQIMKARLPGVDSELAYGIYLCSGILTWSFFTEIVTRGQTVFLDNASLLKKLSFPRVCLPIVLVMSSSLNFLIVFSLFTLFLVVSGNFPGWVFFSSIIVLFVQLTFAIGLGITLGVLNVFFRDIAQFFGIVLQFWFWFTPIVYPISILPSSIQRVVEMNPMTVIMSGYQNIFVLHQIPDWWSLGKVFVIAILLCGWGILLFRRRADEMMDEL